MFDALNGYKTYIAAAGLLGLGLFQLTSGELDAGFKTLAEALAVFGLRRAVK